MANNIDRRLSRLEQIKGGPGADLVLRPGESLAAALDRYEAEGIELDSPHFLFYEEGAFQDGPEEWAAKYSADQESPNDAASAPVGVAVHV